MLNRISVRKAVLFSCAAACLAAMPAVTSASTVYTANWTGGTGDWSNSANWLYSPAAPSPVTFPDDGNDGLDYAVQINTAGPTILDVSASVFALRIGINGTLATASGGSPVLNVGPDSFENDGKIEIVDNSSLTTGGTINNNGVINIGSGGTGGASTLIASGNTTLSGNGSVILAGGDSSMNGNGYALTVASTISGTGTITGFSTLTNEGFINANVFGGKLTINGEALTNDGTINADAGTLALTDTTVNGSGRVYINTGSNLILSGATLNNVNLYSAGGVITIAAGAASLINNSGNGIFNMNGTLTIADAATLNLEGNVGSGSGVISVGDSSGPATLGLAGNTTLNILTALGGQSAIQGNGNTLTVEREIVGTGTITGFSTLTNDSTINANAAGGQLTIKGGTVANSNQIEASNGGTLALTDTTISGNGQVNLYGTGNNLILSGTTLNNVILSSSSSSVITVAAGAASLINNTGSGSFSVNGTLNIADAGTLNLEGNIGPAGTGVINVGDGSSAAILGLAGNTTLGIATVLEGQSTLQGNGYALTLQSGISGTGSITGFSTLTNDGNIDANVAGKQLTISGGAVVNNRLIEASNGGTLALTNTTVSGNGQLDANGTGANLILSGTTLNNITLGSSSGGMISVATGAASLINDSSGGNLDLSGTLNIADGATLNVEGYMGGGPGVLNVGDGSGPGSLILVGNTTLGVNTVLNGQSVIQGNGYALTLQSGISGTGTITGFSTLTNNGTIDANITGGQLTISGGTVANSQIIEASNGGTLALTNTTVSGSRTVALNGTGANLILSGTTLNNVFLNSYSGSVITVAAGAASLINDTSGGNPNLNGTLNIADAATLNVEGNMGGGSGVLNVGDGSSPATLALVGTTTLGVTTVLSGQSVIQGNGNALTVMSTISGTGTLTGFSTLTNYGTIDANVAGGQHGRRTTYDQRQYNRQ